jgi:hypothetical protein
MKVEQALGQFGTYSVSPVMQLAPVVVIEVMS